MGQGTWQRAIAGFRQEATALWEDVGNPVLVKFRATAGAGVQITECKAGQGDELFVIYDCHHHGMPT